MISLIAGAAIATEAMQSKIVGASLFKNGFAVLVRATDIVNNEAIISEVPQAALGTFWLSTSPGVTITEATTMTQQTPNERDAASLDELLGLNIGKRVMLRLNGNQNVEGTLKADTGAIVLIEVQGAIAAYQKAQIESVIVQGQVNTKIKGMDSRRVIRVKTRGAGKIFTLALEQGMTWAPGYSIDITDPKKLSITGKATILNDLSDLDGIETRLITGFPNLPYANVPDPFTAPIAVRQFTDSLMQTGSGAFGGGGFGAAGQMSNRAYDARDKMTDFSQSFEMTYLPGAQNEDLFFYRLANVSLKSGERGYFVLFKAESEYENIYTWDIGDSVRDGVTYVGIPDAPGDVWHSLKFKNTSEQPWTTATATTMKNGEILGQDMMGYTPKGAESIVKITKALDVRAQSYEEEVTRQHNAIRIPENGPWYDLVTVKSTVEVKNMKPEAVKIRITRDVTGEITATEGDPVVTKTARGLHRVNSQAHLKWEKTIEPGKSMTMTFTYKVYVGA